MQKLYPQGEYDYLDGVRLDIKTSMVTIRASQNGPYITVKYEAKTKKEYEQIKQNLALLLKKHPEIDWKVGVNISALADNT